MIERKPLPLALPAPEWAFDKMDQPGPITAMWDRMKPLSDTELIELLRLIERYDSWYYSNRGNSYLHKEWKSATEVTDMVRREMAHRFQGIVEARSQAAFRASLTRARKGRMAAA